MRPILCALLLTLVACGSSSSPATPTPTPGKGSRTLAVDVREAGNESYDDAFQLAKGLGIDEIKISLDWNSIEKATGFDFTIPDIVESYYPANGMPITLVLRPINTNATTLPTDLAALAFDHATVISRFQAFVTALAARLPSVTIRRVLVGNEIDSYLGTDATRWAAFTAFFLAVQPTVKAAFGSSVEVSTIGQFSGHTNPSMQTWFQAFAQVSDFVAVNYYPLNADFTVRPISTVAADFAEITALYPGRNIVFQECGLPSGALCNSTETTQSEFIQAVFRAWDTHKAQIAHIDFTWQSDAPTATVDAWVIQYGLSGQPGEAAFREYLATLGLRTSTGQPKAAWTTLQTEASARGW